VRRRLSFGVAALGAVLLAGLLTVVLAATRWYWVALGLWAAISGHGFFTSTPAASPSSSCSITPFSDERSAEASAITSSS
jgi:hypothetical protein